MASRWDGRTWLTRTAAAFAVVLAGPLLGTGADVVAVGTLVALLWVPGIAVGEWLRCRRPGSVTTAASLLVDLASVVWVARSDPGLHPVLVTVVAATTVLHVQRGPRRTSLVALPAALLVQLVVLPDGASVAVAVAVDVLALLLATSDPGDQRRRNRAVLGTGDGDRTGDPALAGIAEAMVVTDAHGRIVASNDAASITFDAEVHGTCDATLGLRRGAEVLDCRALCPLLGADGTAAAEEVSRELPSGDRQVLLANVSAQRDPFGAVREVVHSFRDVTPIKRVEEERSLVLAASSHELKTPLSVIAGFAELLAADRLDEDQRHSAAAAIQARSQQLLQFVERLLLTTRLQSGAVEVPRRPLDIGGLVGEVAVATGAAATRRVEVDRPGTLPLAVADEETVATVVEHLVDNACKYSPEGSTVSVRLSHDELHVNVDVADNGIGMSREQVLRCFDPFWRAGTGGGAAVHGTGVGLYVVRSLARALGGDARVLASVPGSGTVLRVALPRADVDRRRRTDRRAGPSTSVDEWLRQTGAARHG